MLRKQLHIFSRFFYQPINLVEYELRTYLNIDKFKRTIFTKMYPTLPLFPLYVSNFKMCYCMHYSFKRCYCMYYTFKNMLLHVLYFFKICYCMYYFNRLIGAILYTIAYFESIVHAITYFEVGYKQ